MAGEGGRMLFDVFIDVRDAFTADNQRSSVRGQTSAHVLTIKKACLFSSPRRYVCLHYGGT